MSRVSLSRLAPALAIVALGLSPALQAQSLSDFQNLSPEEKRAYWDSMSEQEREAKREEWRAQRDAMSDEERAAMREQMESRRQEMRNRWESMSEEERDAFRAERRARWESMSDEERAAARERRSQHHGQDGQRKGRRPRSE